MKVLAIIISFLLCVVVTYAQDITVKADENLQADKNLSEYKTFGWTSDVDDQLEAGVYFLNDISLKMNVRDALQKELEGLGYEMEKSNPDLLVNFRVFDKPATLKGFEGEGESVWGNEVIREPSDTTSYNVDAGTLFVSFLDKENGEVVWQGFASGLIDQNQNFMKDEGKVDEAVELLFEKVDHRADDYSMKK